MLLVGKLGKRVKWEGISMLRLCIDNTSVVHITNAFVASCRPMMRELRRLKVVLARLGLQLSSELDTLGRQQLSRQLVAAFLAWRPGSAKDAAEIRRGWDAAAARCLSSTPAWGATVFLRRQCHAELASAWHATDETRLLFPPPTCWRQWSGI
jgi:hypothetical protein